MAALTPPTSLQVGIFSHDLCISFRIVMQEVFETFAFRVLSDAKALQKSSGETVAHLFERGVKSINTWDSDLKARYRAQVVARYRQFAELYRHIFLTYVEQMYSESLGDVTVRVNIPSLSNMIYTFLKMACNNPAVYRGEYVSSMGFMARVLFIETAVRRTLYELLVQQNNIKGISLKPAAPSAPASVASRPTTPRRTPAGAAVTVMSDEVNSHDLAMGQPADPTARPSIASQNQAPGPPTAASRTSMPSLHSSLLANNAPVVNNAAPAQPAPIPTAPTGNAPPIRFFASPTPPAIAAGVGAAMAATVSARKTPTAAAPTSPASVMSPPPGTVTTSSPSASKASGTGPSLAPSSVTNTTVKASASASGPSTPAEQGSAVAPDPTPAETAAAAARRASAPLFELASQFTAQRPHGGFPNPKPALSTEMYSKHSDLDSLQLLPSDQDFTNEVKRLFDNNNSTNTIPPFDSVTNIAQGSAPLPTPRKSVFMPPPAR